MPITRARSARSAVAAVPLLAAIVLAVCLAVSVAGPAQAHDTTVLVKVTAPVPAEPGAPVRLTAVTTYPDGHRAGGLTVKAVAAQGARKVTVALAAGSRRGDWTGSAKLGPGRWSVKVTAAGTSHGTGSANVTVPPPAPATTVAEQAASQALPLDASASGGRMAPARWSRSGWPPSSPPSSPSAPCPACARTTEAGYPGRAGASWTMVAGGRTSRSPVILAGVCPSPP